MEKYQYASRIPCNIMFYVYKNIKYVIAVNISFFLLANFFVLLIPGRLKMTTQIALRLCGRLQDSQPQT